MDDVGGEVRVGVEDFWEIFILQWLRKGSEYGLQILRWYFVCLKESISSFCYFPSLVNKAAYLFPFVFVTKSLCPKLRDQHDLMRTAFAQLFLPRFHYTYRKIFTSPKLVSI